MKTDQQIATEVFALKAIKPRIRKTSAFGDNHHDAIDCQIEALEKRMDENTVYDRNDGAAEDEAFAADNERDAALDAVRWMRDEDDAVPSESWKSLIVK